MATEAEYEAYLEQFEVIEIRDGAVYKVTKIDEGWVPVSEDDVRTSAHLKREARVGSRFYTPVSLHHPMGCKQTFRKRKV